MHATNNLAVLFDPPQPGSVEPNSEKTFGVCVKGLDLLKEGQSVSRLIEWIELIIILGARKIFFYEFLVHENIKRVLDYYEAKGIVQVTPTSLPGDFPNEPSLRHLFMNHKVKSYYALLSTTMQLLELLIKNKEYFGKHRIIFSIKEKQSLSLTTIAFIGICTSTTSWQCWTQMKYEIFNETHHEIQLINKNPMCY